MTAFTALRRCAQLGEGWFGGDEIRGRNAVFGFGHGVVAGNRGAEVALLVRLCPALSGFVRSIRDSMPELPEGPAGLRESRTNDNEKPDSIP